MITIAVFFIFQLMAFNLSFTGGTERPELAVPDLAEPTSYNTPFYYIALGLRGRHRSPSPGWSGDPGSASSSGRSGTTRTGRAASACTAMRVKLVGVRDLRARSPPVIGAVWFFYLNAGRAADRLRPAVRPDPRADGVPRRLRVDLRAGARRADHRAADALAEHPAAFSSGYAAARSCSAASSSSSCSSCRAGSSRPAASGSPGSGPGDARGRSPPTTMAVRRPADYRSRPSRSASRVGSGRCPVTALLRTEGIMKAYGGVQALQRRDDRRRGGHRG